MCQEENSPSVTLLVSRSKALTRTIAWGAPAVICATVSFVLFSRLDLTPSGLTNRLVEFSIAICLLPVAVAAIWLTVVAARWFALAVWPGRLGVFAGPESLELRFGSFGTHRFDADRLNMAYPFEQDLDASECGVEAFLPEEKQRETLLPQITFPGEKTPINQSILRFVAPPEIEAAAALRSWIESQQARHAQSGRTQEKEES